MAESGLVAIREGPEGGDYYELRAAGDQFPEGLWEREVPAYQHARFAQGGVKGFVRLVG